MNTIAASLLVPGVPIIEKVLRPVVVYCFLVAALRLAGKRELAQLNPFDLVVLLTLSNTVQNAIIGDDNSVTGGLIGATTLLVVNYLLARFLFTHRRAERLVEGEPTVLVEGGVIREDRLKQELLTREELEHAARRQGIGSLDSVDRAILDPGGAITFAPRNPTAEETKQRELLDRLSGIERQLGEIQGRLGTRG
jgi:uncharacterized membrane protein YcaP (DUF421 family)